MSIPAVDFHGMLVRSSHWTMAYKSLQDLASTSPSLLHVILSLFTFFLSMLAPFCPFPVWIKNVFIFYLTSIFCIPFALTSMWYIFPKLFSFLIPSQPSNLISDITWSRKTFLDTLAKCALCYSVSFISVVNFFS